MELTTVLNELDRSFETALNRCRAELRGREVGTVTYVSGGIARVEGLPNVQLDELLHFPGELWGMAYNLDPGEVGVVMLGDSGKLKAGDTVLRTGRVLDVPVGEALLGRVVDAIGRPLDSRGPVRARGRRPAEREAPAILDRAPVTVPLQTGLKVVDAMVPVGRGQRELIAGDRQTGKTAIALDTIINQKGKEVLCVYCAVGQRGAAVAKLVSDLQHHGAMDYTTVVVAEGSDPPGLQFITPYAATTMAEYFMEQGCDVLIVYDDLTRHAQAYRELSLLLRRPPGREAFPGDIFYIHSRLLERSTHLREQRGGGSLTALPIIETEAQNLAAYIPTNLISITDGQIYLSPDLFQKGVLPAVDVGKSVSRVGGKTQLPAYRAVAGDLRLSYAQFEELEVFSRFSMRLDESTRKTLERGWRVREILKQPQYAPIPVPEQIAVLLAVTGGSFDELPLDRIGEAALALTRAVAEEMPALSRHIESGEKIRNEDRQALLEKALRVVHMIVEE
ncbi:alternate F1F0 ATPase, F1 subunit alpha [Desulfoscipio gibsoniae]|uniref:ATP synthase subunit alpha n=1 Tax=Desulfoscipio gibsoniae DSM 7213 TaxID=767817 RepID=R4KJN2_9FIRM|nr:alternate F1F0 ATPase, F1 subunit alpha [Desulfoscipio gibsoniae]AGL03408.1 proton translocating ATP synthase, F1 alpha subunit [Desulfoscipio gibsoniae DSM 7213]